MKLTIPTSRGVYRLILIALLGLFLVWRLTDLIAGSGGALDIVVFLVWATLLLGPLYSEVSWGGVGFKQIVEDAKSEIRREIASTRNELATAIATHNSLSQSIHIAAPTGSIPASSPEVTAPQKSEPRRSAMELKILNTLIHKQMRKWPDLSQRFTFRIAPADPEFVEWRVASSKLLGEGLVSETDEGQVFLTDKGFRYCAEHYSSFPKDQWWPEEKMGLLEMLELLSPKQ